MKSYAVFDFGKVGFVDRKYNGISIQDIEMFCSDYPEKATLKYTSRCWVILEFIHQNNMVTYHRLKVKKCKDGEYVRLRYKDEGIDWRIKARDFVPMEVNE